MTCGRLNFCVGPVDDWQTKKFIFGTNYGKITEYKKNRCCTIKLAGYRATTKLG